MKKTPLESQTIATLGVSLKLSMDYTDFNGTGVASQSNDNFSAAWTSGTAQVIEPPTYVAVTPPNSPQTILIGGTTNKLPAGIEISHAILNVITPFTSSGGAITSLTLSLGDAGSGTQFLAATDLKTAAYTLTSAAGKLESAAAYISGTATISGQTMGSLNAGKLEIYIMLRPIADLATV